MDLKGQKINRKTKVKGKEPDMTEKMRTGRLVKLSQ